MRERSMGSYGEAMGREGEKVYIKESWNNVVGGFIVFVGWENFLVVW